LPDRFVRTLIIVAVISLGIFACFRGTPLQARGHAIQKADLGSSALSGQGITDRQRQCTKQARERFAQIASEKNGRTVFADYYNERLNKCIVEIEIIEAVNGGDKVAISKSLTDSAGREYGAYLSFGDGEKDAEEKPPSVCEFYLSSGEAIDCQSSAEFDELEKGYLKQ
jgi:hypothetical protein